MFKMWQVNGIEPEVYNYKTGKVEEAGYPLRPEIVESTYYLYHYTNDPKYLAMGKQMFDDFVKYCRTDVAYAGLKSVVTKEKTDYMHSFRVRRDVQIFLSAVRRRKRRSILTRWCLTPKHIRSGGPGR